MYICNHFNIEELVWEKLYFDLHRKRKLWVAWRRFDDRALKTIDMLRNEFGSIIINDWAFGGSLEFSGARPVECREGAKYSSHKDWNTFDVKFNSFRNYDKIKKQEAYFGVQKYILKHSRAFPFVTAMEDIKYTPSWLHLTTGNFRHSNGDIRIIKP